MLLRSPASVHRPRGWRHLSTLALALAGLAGAVAGAVAHGRLEARRALAATGAGTAATAEPRPPDPGELAALDVPTLRLDIQPKHVLAIRQKRAEAIAEGQLFASDEDLVPAVLHAEGKVLRVRLRLKGDLEDHWSGRRWSFRVEVQGGDTVLGMRRFSLQDPRTRHYTSEWLYHRSLEREGVLALRYLFVRLVVNGEDVGLYALEEHFSKELLERQRRRESVILKLDESDFWRRASRTGTELVPDHMTHVGEVPEAFRERQVLASPQLAGERAAAIEALLGFIDRGVPASKVFKVAELARFLALTDLLNSWHALRWHNLRFYYDPVASRLEPIGFDAMLGDASKYLLNAVQETWVLDALEDPAFARAYVAELTRMSTEAYFERVRDLGDEWRRAVAIVRTEWPEWEPDRVWTAFRAKQEHVRKLLAAERLLVAYLVPGRDGAGATLRLGNITLLPVEVLGWRIDDGELRPIEGEGGGPLLLPGKRAGDAMAYREVALPDAAAAGAAVVVVSRLAGSSRDTAFAARPLGAEITSGGRRPDAPTVEQALARHRFLEREGVGGPGPRLRVRPGEWTVAGDLVLPEGWGLEAGPGTTLRFAPGAVLVATGPLRFEGSSEAPVRLVPERDSWAGIVVLDAPPSSWTRVEVRATTSIDRSGWTTTGGVNFQASPVAMEACRFIGSLGEDAVNAIRTRVDCRECHFGDTRFDAFDGDFVEALFERSSFARIGGDAIDVSGSRLEVREVAMTEVKDKAVSVGEESRAEVTRLSVRGAKIALASKDLSRVEAHGVRAVDCRVGLAAYVKKPEYGPAFLAVEDFDFPPPQGPGAGRGRRYPALPQPGSEIVINGQRAPERDYPTEWLYGEI